MHEDPLFWSFQVPLSIVRKVPMHVLIVASSAERSLALGNLFVTQGELEKKDFYRFSFKVIIHSKCTYLSYFRETWQNTSSSSLL